MSAQKPFHYKRFEIKQKKKDINLQKVISKMQNKKQEINAEKKEPKLHLI